MQKEMTHSRVTLFIAICTIILLGPSLLNNLYFPPHGTSQALAQTNLSRETTELDRRAARGDLAQTSLSPETTDKREPSIGYCIGRFIGYVVIILVSLWFWSIPFIGWFIGGLMLYITFNMLINGPPGGETQRLGPGPCCSCGC